MARNAVPFIGIKAGMLLVIKDLGIRKGYKRFVLCQCDCGKVAEVSLSNIRTGHTRSCGCVKTTWQKSGQTTHGLSHTSEHGIWQGMIARCDNPRDAAYKNYGGRGIKVCQRWADSFENFLHDMGPRPSKAHSLDRFPDNNGDYGPQNCRWATKKQQANNTRTNAYYDFDGQVKTQQEWAEYFGVKRWIISNHIRRGKTFAQIVKYINENRDKLVKF